MSAGRRALITGLTGQDGSLLADGLLANGYEVDAVVRSPDGNLGSAGHLRNRVRLHQGDLLVPATLIDAVRATQPDELFHLAAPSFVPASWSDPAQTFAAIAGATATILRAVRDHSPHTRVLVAGSAQMYGDAPESPQSELTPCRPRSPYGTAKLAAHQLVGQIRRHDGLFACSAILYNHESERRPEHFVVRKVTRGAAAIKLGLAAGLRLGDMSPVRDWSDARDIVTGCRLMLAHAEPDDFVLASGIGHTVAQLVDAAFAHVGLNPADHVVVEADLVRTPELTPSIGDPARARRELGWIPETSFEQLIGRLVDHDLQQLAVSEQTMPGAEPG